MTNPYTSPRSDIVNGDGSAVVMKWNLVPASLICIVAFAWMTIAAMGISINVTTWDSQQDSLKQLSLETIQIAAFLLASGTCAIAGKNWLRANTIPATRWTIAGVLTPVLVFALIKRFADWIPYF